MDDSFLCVCAGVCRRDGQKRWSYLSLGSQSDISNDITNQEADLVSYNSPAD